MASKEDAKEANAARVKRHRERNADVTPCNAPVTLCNASVTQNRDIAEAEAEADTDTDIKHKPKRERFTKPSAAEVAAYGATLSPPFLESENFVDFYESKGWTVGKQPMKDWKATVRTWNRRNNSTQRRPGDLNQADHDIEGGMKF
jgi:hypothetical protein